MGEQNQVWFSDDLRADPTKSEAPLKGLVHLCRAAMVGQETRLVYFDKPNSRPGRRPHPRRSLAVKLLEGGHTMQAVADALGVSRTSIQRWGGSSQRPRGRPGHVDVPEDETALEQRGLEHLMDMYDVLGPRELAQVLELDAFGLRSRAVAVARVLDDMRGGS